MAKLSGLEDLKGRFLVKLFFFSQRPTMHFRFAKHSSGDIQGDEGTFCGRLSDAAIPSRGTSEKKLDRFWSGKKKGTNPNFWGPDILRWGWGLPCEGVGARKFGMSLETRETKLSWRDILAKSRSRDFCQDIPEVHEKLEKKKVCVRFLAPIWIDIGSILDHSESGFESI